MKRILLIALTIALPSCAPKVRGLRMGGFFPAYAANCSLELRSIVMTPAFLAEFETLGTLMVEGELGETPESPRILGLVKPAACAWGGEVVSINTSVNLENRFGVATASMHTFMVFRKKQAATAPKTF